MPFLNVKVTGPRLSEPQARSLQERATELIVQVMRKKGSLTVVSIEQAPEGAWSVGGAPVPSAAFLEVKVTAGTNTTAEKARFVEEANQMLRDVFGPGLDPVTYVVVHEVPAEDWGFGGLTQARRSELAKAA